MMMMRCLLLLVVVVVGPLLWLCGVAHPWFTRCARCVCCLCVLSVLMLSCAYVSLVVCAVGRNPCVLRARRPSTSVVGCVCS